MIHFQSVESMSKILPLRLVASGWYEYRCVGCGAIQERPFKRKVKITSHEKTLEDAVVHAVSRDANPCPPTKRCRHCGLPSLEFVLQSRKWINATVAVVALNVMVAIGMMAVGRGSMSQWLPIGLAISAANCTITFFVIGRQFPILDQHAKTTNAPTKKSIRSLFRRDRLIVYLAGFFATICFALSPLVAWTGLLPANRLVQPAVVGPGDTAHLVFANAPQVRPGAWRGRVDYTLLEPQQIRPPIKLDVTSGGGFSLENSKPELPFAAPLVHAEMVVPERSDLIGRTLRLRVDIDLDYFPLRSRGDVQPGVRRQSVSQQFQVHIARRWQVDVYWYCYYGGVTTGCLFLAWSFAWVFWRDKCNLRFGRCPEVIVQEAYEPPPY